MALAFVLLAVLVTQAGVTELQPDAQISRALEPGEVHRLALTAAAADLIKIKLTVGAAGVGVTLEVRDAAGRILARRTLDASESTPEERVLGFVAHDSARYLVGIRRTGTSLNGSYTIQMSRQSADSRMKGLAVAEPRSDAPSARIAKLKRDISAGVKGAEDAFWRDASRNGGPFVEGPAGQGDVLVTFVWRQIFPTSNVQVWWSGRDSRYMSHVPGTSVWSTTLRVRDDSRFGYAISPNDRTEDRNWTLELDPLNRKRFPDTEGLRAPAAVSVFEMPGAPDMRWVNAAAPRKGTLQEIRLESAVSPETPILATVYTPPGYRPDLAPYPLMVLFRKWDYLLGAVHVPTILDNLIAAGRIRPVIACFIDLPGTNPFRPDSPFPKVVATEVVPLLRSRFAISGSASDLIIGGFSGGAQGAALVAFNYPRVFGNVLSQSAGLNQVDASGRPNRVARLFEEAERLPIRFYLDVGLYEANTERNRSGRLS